MPNQFRLSLSPVVRTIVNDSFTSSGAFNFFKISFQNFIVDIVQKPSTNVISGNKLPFWYTRQERNPEWMTKESKCSFSIMYGLVKHNMEGFLLLGCDGLHNDMRKFWRFWTMLGWILKYVTKGVDCQLTMAFCWVDDRQSELRLNTFHDAYARLLGCWNVFVWRTYIWHVETKTMGQVETLWTVFKDRFCFSQWLTKLVQFSIFKALCKASKCCCYSAGSPLHKMSWHHDFGANPKSFFLKLRQRKLKKK